MARGKQTCKILKEIRKQIAAENDIKLVVEECTFQGDCLGTCPKCEAEVRYLERELEKRQRMGKVAVLAGMSLGTMFATTSCDSQKSLIDKEPLAGDVVAVVPDAPSKIIRDTIQEDLMGIVRIFRQEYHFGIDVYQKTLKDLFVFPQMENLSFVSGVIQYEHVGRGEVLSTFEKLVEATKAFSAPYYPEGEQKLMETITAAVQNSPFSGRVYRGVMEVEFTVDPSGAVEDVMIKEGLDVDIDAVMIAAFKQMRWIPAQYELKDGTKMPFTCRCSKRIPFPVE